MKTLINVLLALLALTGIVFVLGAGENPMIALAGIAMLAPVAVKLEYDELKKIKKNDDNLN